MFSKLRSVVIILFVKVSLLVEHLLAPTVDICHRGKTTRQLLQVFDVGSIWLLVQSPFEPNQLVLGNFKAVQDALLFQKESVNSVRQVFLVSLALSFKTAHVQCIVKINAQCLELFGHFLLVGLCRQALGKLLDLFREGILGFLGIT